MKTADDPLAPPSDAFEEAWQAQTLAIADTMVQAGHFSAEDWAQALGQELAQTDLPDTLNSYFLCALAALEKLAARHAILTPLELSARKAEWVEAYEKTPHGAPVTLGPE